MQTFNENINAEKQFQIWMKYLKTFDDVNKCSDSIQSERINLIISLIINELLDSYVMSRIHSSPHVISIYIYSANQEKA